MLIRMLFAISLAFLASGATAGSDVYDWLSLKDEYSMSIKPIFDSKCVACHSCFNGPCQLKLSSFWGAHRGASKIGIYDFARATAIKPTRMFEDARTTNDWRKKGFYSVVDANTNNKPILLTMIEDLGGIEDGLQTMYESEKSRVCINSASKKNILNYKEKNKSGRMPYGLPKLSTKEISAIKKWIRGGASGPDLQEVENQVLNHPKIKHLVKKWENFLNQEDLKTQLSARYFYEHLFLAHIAFDKKSGIYFRLVRSKSKIGIIQPIGTALPYDDPNRKFYYRFMPELETLTYKNHIPFYLDNKKLAKWKKEFVLSTWKEKLTKLPAYGRSGANPFKVFRLIPVQARYNFLLDEAGYFVMSFIKGPVCRGPTALNVINDHFWVMFVDPKEDPSVNDPTLYSFIEGKMNFPAAAKGDIMPISEYRQRYWQTVKFKFDRIKSKGKATSTKMIWNGGKNKNTNSLLTVFRHFDSAHVMRGLQGRTPKTLWLLDYHVFETIYYNLTAGYNVFGPGQHQLNSRVFMDLSRIAAEDYFISMLPQKYRTPLRLNWNKPAPKSKKNTKFKLYEYFFGTTTEKIKFKFSQDWGKVTSVFKPTVEGDNNLTKQVVDKILIRFPINIINGTQSNEPHRREVSSLLSRLDNLNNLGLVYLPDTITIRLKNNRSSKSELYTLIHNRDHYNVASMFFEKQRLNETQNSVTLVSGIAAPYVNLFVDISSKDLQLFVAALEGAVTKADIQTVLSTYGVLRSSEEFWEIYEWASNQPQNELTGEKGWLDLNRYVN